MTTRTLQSRRARAFADDTGKPRWRGWWRLVVFAMTSAMHAVRALRAARGAEDTRRGGERVAAWSRAVLWRTGVRVQVHGRPQTEAGLLVANHRSYLDVAAIASCRPCVFVAKAEVAAWPVVGVGARAAGCLFVKRESADSRRDVRAELRRRIGRGETVAVFAEGTTTAGPGMLPLRPGSFFAAAEAGVPVTPVAVVYENADLAYFGDDSFVPHFVDRFRRRRMRAHVSFGPTLRGDDGADLHAIAERWMRAEIERLQGRARDGNPG